MFIRPASVDDLPPIERIQRASPETVHWPAADYLAYDCLVAAESQDAAVAGFLVSRDLGQEREILNLAVHPAFRRRGVGAALLGFELSRGAHAWFLEVRRSNHAARHFYAKAGFRELTMRSGYYDDPPESAIVMRFLS